jgi:hypothetical protein
MKTLADFNILLDFHSNTFGFEVWEVFETFAGRLADYTI